MNHGTTMKNESTYYYQDETLHASNALPIASMSTCAHDLGLREHEPLIVILDALNRYAKAYHWRLQGNLSDDGFLGPAWLAAATGVRTLLYGDGAIAWEEDIKTDSKDNGACESMFWSAMESAGFTEDDL